MCSERHHGSLNQSHCLCARLAAHSRSVVTTRPSAYCPHLSAGGLGVGFMLAGGGLGVEFFFGGGGLGIGFLGRQCVSGICPSWLRGAKKPECWQADSGSGKVMAIKVSVSKEICLKKKRRMRQLDTCGGGLWSGTPGRQPPSSVRVELSVRPAELVEEMEPSHVGSRFFGIHP